MSDEEIQGPFLHGTKAELEVGAELVAGFDSNFKSGRVMNHVYFTSLVPTAAWGAQLASALAGSTERGHIYVVEPLGDFEDDPNVTDKKFPGNPTRSYRSTAPLRVVGEITEWTRLTPEELQVWRERLTVLVSDEGGEIIN